MGTKYWEAVCDENSIGGSGEYFGDSHAHLGHIYVLHHEALGGKFDAGNPVSHSRGQIWAKRHYKG